MQWSGSSLTGGCSSVVTKRRCLIAKLVKVDSTWNGWQHDIEDFVDNGVQLTGSGHESMLSKLKMW